MFVGYRGRRDYYRSGRDGEGGGGGGRSQQQQGPTQNFRQQQSNTATKPPVYDSEFDFESANARFKKETLEKEFKEKLRLDSASRKSSESYGEGEEAYPGSDEEDEEEVVVVEDKGVEDEVEYYDKTKSFFDNISREESSNK